MTRVQFRHPSGALSAVTLGALACVAQPTTAPLRAQGVTTATIGGGVRSAEGSHADGAYVRVVNRATGYAVETSVRRGRFLVAGLEVGGPYVVSVRRIGFAPQERGGLFLSLGQQLDVDFGLEPLANQLETVHVVSAAGRVAFARSRAGTGATISDSLLGRMPALNRDVFDFARLVPQAATRFGGLSGAGVGLRFNSYLIDGVSERLLFSNATLSGTLGGKPISIDAVKEYEVLLAPYDVRYGDFAGALVNAVTKSGTNELHGSAFAYGRNEALARNTPFLRNTPFWRSQIGVAVGGPIIRDRAHFFVSTEIQRHEQPAPGPYLGQSNASGTRVPASEVDVERFADILRGYGLDPGSGGRVNRTNPNVNVFARVDVSLPRMKSRLVLRHNYALADMTLFSRAAGSSVFPLSSNAWTQRIWRSGTTVQVFTHLRDGALNEFLVSPGSAAAVSAQYTRSPLITATVPGVGVPTAALVAGPPENGQAFGALNTALEVADHLVVRPSISHTLSAGARAEIFSARNTSTRRQFGTWTFSSLDSLQRGEASGFRVEKDFGSATARLRGLGAGAYIGDAWQVTDRLSITSGLRADLLAFRSRPLYSRAVDSVFGRRTSDFPRPAVHWSPRVGFSWDLDAARQSRLRGGAGIFVGRPPLVWVHQSRRFDGVGNRGLLCRGGTGVVPPFVPDPWNPPASCADGRGFAEGLVNLVDAHLRMTEMFRVSLAYDRSLAWDVAASLEALYTRTRSDFVFVNPNLKGPVGVDRHGRVLYGTFNAAGVGTPALVSRQYEEITDLRNHSQGHSLALTGRLEKRFSPGLAASVAYTRARVRDVQSLIATRGDLTYNNWAGGRTVSGRHDDLTPGVSSYEIPHRVVATMAWTAPWKRLGTDLAMYYVGESGIPFTYTDSTAGGLGDLNADGTNANDPIYVALNATDASEIAFAGDADEVRRQQIAFEHFVASTPCLRRQRGRIVARNSCRGPWVHSTNASLRQALPAMWGHGLSVQVEVFNVLNLLNQRWGLFRVPNPVALQQVVPPAGSAPLAQPLFRFDAARATFDTQNVESAYQIQLALRYRF